MSSVLDPEELTQEAELSLDNGDVDSSINFDRYIVPLSATESRSIRP